MSKRIAKHLLDIKAVSLQPSNPFTWSSGMKSPVYCDNRLTLSYPAIRKVIANGLADLIKSYFSEVDVIAGTATAGIPHAAWVSDILDLPMCYVRSKAKGHGKGNQIEGEVRPGQKVVVVEDLISTGGSVLTSVEALREAGCDVLGVVAIFTYGLAKGEANFNRENISVYTLTNLPELMEVAAEEKYLEQADIEKLMKWRHNPESVEWLL